MTTVSLSDDLHQDLSAYVIKLLQKNRIATIYDFVRADTDRLLRITNLSFELVSAIKRDFTNRYSGNTVRVAEYFRYLSELVDPIPTGIRGLDALLDGGLLPGHVMEVFGEPACGKSQLCMTIAANAASRGNVDVFYVDTKCDFSATRVQSMLRAKKCSEVDASEAMQRIKVERIHSPEQLLGTLEELLAQIDRQERFRKFRVLLVDSLPALWYAHQNSSSSCYPVGMLTSLAGLLRKLASENMIAVVVVNLRIVSTDSRTIQPALGRHWEMVPTTRLLLSKLPNAGQTEQNRLISVAKSNYLKTNDRQMVSLSERGFV
uniref:Putative dna repair protein rad51 log 4 n=1 Tax=Culex tarsalis TaxID=7177 RepID=A0A1Q3F5I0_CULTA